LEHLGDLTMHWLGSFSCTSICLPVHLSRCSLNRQRVPTVGQAGQYEQVSKTQSFLPVNFCTDRAGRHKQDWVISTVLWRTVWPGRSHWGGRREIEKGTASFRLAGNEETCDRLSVTVPRYSTFWGSWEARTFWPHQAISSYTYALLVLFVPRNKYKLSVSYLFSASASGGYSI
jgi:hypothetical protein